jgi:hypothetical protein
MMIMVLVSAPLSQIGDVLGDLEVTESEASEIIEEKKEEIEVHETVVHPEVEPATVQLLQEGHYSLYLSAGILVFAISFLIVSLKTLLKIKNPDPQDIIMITGLIVVVSGAIFISVASTSTEGMSTSISLLSAIAGYIFGAQSRKGK